MGFGNRESKKTTPEEYEERLKAIEECNPVIAMFLAIINLLRIRRSEENNYQDRNPGDFVG